MGGRERENRVVRGGAGAQVTARHRKSQEALSRKGRFNRRRGGEEGG